MGAAEVRHLKYKDYLNSIKEYIDIEDELDVERIVSQIKKIKDAIGTWILPRYKMTNLYRTFNTPESTHAIADYLLYRVKNNKPIISPDDYLFIDNFNKQINEDAYGKIFERLSDKCGFGRRENDYHFMTSHRLIVAFSTLLYDIGMDIIRCR